MAKKKAAVKKASAKATKALCDVEVTSTIKLMVGDETTDEAHVSCNVKVGSNLDEVASTFSSGISLQIHLPEGTVVRNPVAAKQMAQREAVAILRKMAASVGKEG